MPRTALLLGAALLGALGIGSPARAQEAPAPTDEYLRGYIESWLELTRGLPAREVEVRVEDGVVTLTFDPDRVTITDRETSAIAGFAGVVQVRLDRRRALVAGEETSRFSTWRAWLRPPPGRKTIRFPEGDLFAAPLADQKQPRFHATYQNYATPFGSINMGSVGFGENFGLLRKPGRKEGDGWQVGMSGAVMALFNLDGPSTDLVNADYFFGIPFSWRSGDLSGRLRIYHLSSHVGDEFLLGDAVPDFERINLSYEAIELLGSWERDGYRVYGGGSWIFNTDTDLDRGRLQGGAEYQGKPTEWRNARFVAAVDLQAWEETDRDVDVSAKAGLAFRSPYVGERKLQLLLEYYNGHAPHGQFYVYRVEYFGLGLALSL